MIFNEREREENFWSTVLKLRNSTRTTDFNTWNNTMAEGDEYAISVDGPDTRPLRHLAQNKGLYALMPSVLIGSDAYVMERYKFDTEQDVIDCLDELLIVYNVYVVDEKTRPVYWVRGAKPKHDSPDT